MTHLSNINQSGVLDPVPAISPMCIYQKNNHIDTGLNTGTRRRKSQLCFVSCNSNPRTFFLPVVLTFRHDEMKGNPLFPAAERQSTTTEKSVAPAKTIRQSKDPSLNTQTSVLADVRARHLLPNCSELSRTLSCRISWLPLMRKA